MPTRRQWLKTVAAGSALLAGGWAFWPHGAPPGRDPDGAGAAGYGFLSAADRGILFALLPALAGLAPADGERLRAIGPAVLRDIDATIALQRQAVRDDLRTLFTLLATPAGAWALLSASDIATAPPAALARGLDALSRREFAVFRQAYAGLRDLLLGLWYGQPANWRASAYPGPPDLAKGPRP